jgi:hypothetical protein
MSRAESLVFAFVAGMAAGLVGCIMMEDILHGTPAREKLSCVDRPDTRAYMARLPAEPHNVEFCLQAFRYNAQAWIPEFQHPLKSAKEN